MKFHIGKHNSNPKLLKTNKHPKYTLILLSTSCIISSSSPFFPVTLWPPRCLWSVRPNLPWTPHPLWTVATTMATSGPLLRGSNMSLYLQTWPDWCNWRRASGRPWRGRSHQFPQDTWRTKITAQSTWMAWRPMYSLLSDVMMGPCTPWEERGQLGQAPLIHLSKGVHQLMFWEVRRKPLIWETIFPGHLIREKSPVSHQREKKCDSLWNCRLSSHHNDMQVWVSALIKLISIWYLHFIWFFLSVCNMLRKWQLFSYILYQLFMSHVRWDRTELNNRERAKKKLPDCLILP